MVEKRNRTFHEVNTFNKLIGKSIEGKLNTEILSQMNTATIQVIVNDFHNKIENLNEELVNELMKKDELQVNLLPKILLTCEMYILYSTYTGGHSITTYVDNVRWVGGWSNVHVT